MLFNKFKKVKVQYGIYNEEEIPKSIFPNIKKTNTNYNLKCPAVNSSNSKFYEVNSFLELEINLTHNKETNVLEYRYTFDDSKHPVSEGVHDLIKKYIVIGNANNQHTLQILVPYIFITDDKSLEVTLLDPNLNTQNLEFITGSFNFYGWARGLNLSYYVIDINKPAKILLNVEQPILKYYFSKPVSMEYVEFNDKQLKFIKSVRRATFYRKNANNLYKQNLKRRPKKLLQ